MPITLISLIFLLVSGLSAYDAQRQRDKFVYLPLMIDHSDLLFEDDFSNDKSGWTVKDDADSKKSYQEGEYEILIRKEKWIGVPAPFTADLVDYSVRTEIRQLKADNAVYGIVFDLKNWDHFYYLGVQPDKQRYAVVKFVKGDQNVVGELTVDPVINPGIATNHVQVDRKGDEITVVINGHRFPTVNDAGFSGNLGVGLYFQSSGNVPTEARYDNFSVWQLGNGQPAGVETHLTGPHFAGEADFSASLDWEQ